MKNQYTGKQQQYQQQISSPRNANKRSIAQQYLKEKRPVHFDISSDSDQDESQHQDVEMQRRSYGVKKGDSPVISTQSYRNQSRVSQYGNKNQQIYELNMKIFALENSFLAEKQKLIQKYEKQLFDVNRQKSYLQQQKVKLLKQIDLLNKMNKNYEQQIQQLKQQLQIFVGQNRKTPNFNSMSKDFGQSQLITMMTHKDQKIKDLQYKLKHLSKQKEQIQTSLKQSINKPDRSSGDSFGGNKNVNFISFGQIQENLKKTQNSLKESNQIKENLLKQIEDIKKQLNQELQHSNLLIKENSSIETDRQLKIKQIQVLSDKLNKTQNKQYLIEKQVQNLNKKLKINEDLLQMKEKQVKKLTQISQSQEQKMKRIKRQYEKNEKQWSIRLSKIQNEKSMSINEKMQENKKEQAKLLNKIQNLVSENKKNLSIIDQLTGKQQKLKSQILKTEKQRQDLSKKLQQSTRLCTKIRHTCTIQEERILQLQTNCNTLRNEKKSLKEEAERIMRKQKSEISTLKQSLELMNEKSKKIEQKIKKQQDQIINKQESLSSLKSQLERMNDKLREQVQEKHTLSMQIQKLSQLVQQHQQLIIQLKKENYEMNKQSDRLRSILQEKERHSKQMLQKYQTKKDSQQSNVEKAYQLLKSQYRILQTKFDKQTTQKQEMLQALGQKIKYFQERIQQDSNRYQSVVDEKNLYLQQAEGLTYKCKEMYDYILRMQQNQNMPSNGNQGDAQVLRRNQQQQENQQQQQQQIQLFKVQNQTLKQQLYRITQQIQQLKTQYRAQLQRLQSYKSLSQSNKKPPRQMANSRKSCSLDSSVHEQNPLESVIQLLKNEKQQMLHTIGYQNQMIQQLQQQMGNAMTMLHEKNENSQDERQRQILSEAYQSNIELLQGKLQEINQTILEKQKVMINMKKINDKMNDQLKYMQNNHNEELSRLQLQLNLIKQDKKQLHEQLDNAHSQLIVYEKQRSRQKMIIVNQVRTQLQAKVSFINDDVQKYKLQTKKVKEEMKKLQKQYQVEIQARQQLYVKQRQKLTQQIHSMNQQIKLLQEKLKKANSIIAQEKFVQSESSSKNQHFQLQYFEMKKLNELYHHQIQCLNEEVTNLQLKNQKITQFLHQLDDKNSQIVAEMQHQIEELMKENQHHRQCIQDQKAQNKSLQQNNKIITEELTKQSLSTVNPSSFKQQQRIPEKQTIANYQNAKTFPNSQDTFFMMESPKTQPLPKIFSQPIKNEKQILNLYDIPSIDRVTFSPDLIEVPRQKFYSNQFHSHLILKPKNYTLTGSQAYQNPQKNERKISLPLKKQQVEFYRI